MAYPQGNLYNALGTLESGQNPTVINPNSTPSGNAAGYYQITSGTWTDFAPRAGISLSQYPTADTAPLTVQTAVANNIPLRRWATYNQLSAQFPGITENMTLGQAAAIYESNPSQIQVSAVTPGNSQGDFYIDPSGSTTSPNTGAGSSASGNPASNSTGAAGAGEPGYLPPSQIGGLAATGITPGLAAGITGWITDIETKTGNAFTGAVNSVEAGVTNAFKGALASVENWTLRAFLIFVGVIILFIALWKLWDPDGTKTQKAAEVAVAV